MEGKCRHCGAPLFENGCCTYCDVDLPHEIEASEANAPKPKLTSKEVKQAKISLFVLTLLIVVGFLVLRAA